MADRKEQQPERKSQKLAPGEAPVAVPAASKNAKAPESPHEAFVDSEPVQAQVQGPASEPVTHLAVHETAVVTDRVIKDASDPLAVQVPEAGRGNSLTPLGRTYGVEGAKTPEEQFAENK